MLTGGGWWGGEGGHVSQCGGLRNRLPRNCNPGLFAYGPATSQPLRPQQRVAAHLPAAPAAPAAPKLPAPHPQHPQPPLHTHRA